MDSCPWSTLHTLTPLGLCILYLAFPKPIRYLSAPSTFLQTFSWVLSSHSFTSQHLTFVMARSFEQERGRSSSTSTASSKKSETPYPSRSTSHAQYLENAIEPQRSQSISFNEDGKKTDKSHPRRPREIETPQGPIRRESALESLSQQTWNDPNANVNEPKWPTDWRAYTCLFGGFLLMFNSW